MSDPHGLFRTLGDPLCERDIYGDPLIFAGGNAAVFKIRLGKRYYALKCYTTPRPRTAVISRRVSDTRTRIIVPTTYLSEEIYVFDKENTGGWYDIALTDWIEGETLDNTLRKALRDGDGPTIGRLAAEFDLAAAEMLAAPWAHGDLKPENIFVTTDGKIRLIDIDAMFFPDLEGEDTPETGTPQYQHPARDSHFFNRHMDDYSIALISATLHLLAIFPQLYDEFGNADRFLFSPAELSEGRSECHAKVQELLARRGDGALYTLVSMLRSPSPVIEGLSGIIGYMSHMALSHSGSAARLQPDGHSNVITADPQEGADVCQRLWAYVECGRWGYTGEDGKVAVPPIFDSALEFSEGLAAVKTGPYNHFIDPAGRCVINCSAYDSVKPFHGGRAAVKSAGLWGFIDREGKEIVPSMYEKPPLSRREEADEAYDQPNIR